MGAPERHLPRAVRGGSQSAQGAGFRGVAGAVVRPQSEGYAGAQHPTWTPRPPTPGPWSVLGEKRLGARFLQPRAGRQRSRVQRALSKGAQLSLLAAGIKSRSLSLADEWHVGGVVGCFKASRRQRERKDDCSDCSHVNETYRLII